MRGRFLVLPAAFAVTMVLILSAAAARAAPTSPPAELAPPHVSTPVDTDGDGKFNYFTFDVNVTVHEPQKYYLQGYLHSGSTKVSPAFNLSALDSGTHAVRLTISGARFLVAGANGPFTMDLELYVWTGFTLIDTGSFLTGDYRAADFDPPSIQSPYTTVIPTIDGVMSAGEWADAEARDLKAISGNFVPGLLLVKDDNERLYVAYDAIGDTTENLFDTAAIGFDTGNDNVPTHEREDQFAIGGNIANEEGHLWYHAGSMYWIVHCTPFNENLRNHEGLESGWGFGLSDRLPSRSHRVYEFAIPMDLLGILPGQTIGFFGGSQASPGLYDESADGYSAWPEYGYFLLLNLFGDLTFSPDLTDPVIAIASPSPEAVFGVDTFTVTWTASDKGLGLNHLEISVDGGTPVTLPAKATEYTFAGLPDAAHTVAVTGVDRAGNRGTSLVSVTTDTTPPAVAIASPADGGIVGSASFDVRWTASDATSGVERIEVRLDGGPAVVLPGSETAVAFGGVADGAHTVSVSAFDSAANSADDVAAFRVDDTAPFVTFTSPAAGAIVAGSTVAVQWTAADGPGTITGFEVRLDGAKRASLPPSAREYSIPNVADGVHTVEVAATDSGGNVGTARVEVTVDTQPPALAISLADGTASPSRSVAVTFSATDATSGVARIEVVLDGGRYSVLQGSDGTVTLTGLTDGPHQLQATAIDRAGHPRTEGRSFTVDTVAPFGRIDSPLAGVISASSVPVAWVVEDESGTVSAELRLDDGPWIPLEGSSGTYTLTGVADGDHRISLRATDAAGNVDIVEAQFRVDTALLSPSGPYSVGPIIAILAAAALAGLAVSRLARRRRGG